MKYLTTTFAIAFMAFGFVSIAAIPAHANGASGTFGSCAEKERIGRSAYEQEYGTLRCNVVGQAEIDELHDFADKGNPDGRHLYSDPNPKAEDNEATEFAEKDCKDDPYQRHCLSFADREDGFGGDFGGSGGDFGEGDRAAASTSAE